MMGSLTRTLSFYAKWMAEVIRQPSLMVSLIVGPFLILLLFGQGAQLGFPRPRILVVTPASGDQQQVQAAIAGLSEYVDFVGETTAKQGRRSTVRVLTNDIDPVRRTYTETYLREQIATLNQQTVQRGLGDAQVSAGEVQQLAAQARRSLAVLRAAGGDPNQTRAGLAGLRAVLGPLAFAAGGTAATSVAPLPSPSPGPSPTATPAAGARSPAQAAASLQQTTDQIDRRLAAGDPRPASDADLARMDSDLATLEQAAAEVQSIPAWVLSAPFDLEVVNISRFTPTYIGFYAPAVLALLVQHLAITLGALSMARIRLLGLMELLQTSPARPSEVVVGNYISYGTLCVIAAALLTFLLVWALSVPVFGSLQIVAATLGLLIVCSLGVGFVISMISSSEQQAAQIAMLVLISTVFFSGFVIAVDAIAWPVRAFSYVLPATYAIRTLQDEMLRGALRHPYDLVVLGVAGVALFAVMIWLFRREYRPK
jgi:ABC-2 type transport system permease protein